MISLMDVIAWFTDLRAQGLTRDTVFDAIEFDADEYPGQKILETARDAVWPPNDNDGGSDE